MKKVLIVDDEPGIIETLSDILEMEGFEVFRARNGIEAVEFVQGENVEVILMDFKMPGMNGVEAFREIRRITENAKIIFITAYYQEKLIQEAIQEGAAGICHKPLNIPHLLNTIQNNS